MLSSIRSFAILSACLLVFASTMWVILRVSGQSQSVAPPLEHPFFHGPSKDIIAYHIAGKGSPLERLVAAARISKDIVLWIDVCVRRDGTMVMAETNAEAEQDAPLIKTVLTQLPQNRLILNFRGNREGMIQLFAKEVEEAHVETRSVMQSPEDGFLKGLREGKPQWIYGTSAPTRTKLMMLGSIGLESLAPIKSDIVIIEEN